MYFSLSEINFYFINVLILISAAYLSVDDYNVILIDWREAAADILYWAAANSVPFVAQRVAFLLDFLESKATLNPDTTTIIGYSLGAHVAGLGARFAMSEISEIVGKSRKKRLQNVVH